VADRTEKKDDGSLLMLQQQLGQACYTVDSTSESNKNVQEQFTYSADIIRNVTEKLHQN